jgi:hypothetical protein
MKVVKVDVFCFYEAEAKKEPTLHKIGFRRKGLHLEILETDAEIERTHKGGDTLPSSYLALS